MNQQISYEQVEEAVRYLQAQNDIVPVTGIVLGSGLGPLAEQVVNPLIVPYKEIPHFPRSTVEGHSGRLLLGELAGGPVCVMQGRVHFYEGYSPAQLGFPIRVMQLFGVKQLIVTNAAGGLRSGFVVGDIMAIIDHINLVGLSGNNPLRGPNDDRFGVRFPGVSSVYDRGLLAELRQEAIAQEIPLREGVYAMVAGPSFETPAEIRFLRTIGADAVGMSTAPEVVTAAQAGIKVSGISLITNISQDVVDLKEPEQDLHQEVLEAGQAAMPRLISLLEGFLRRIQRPRFGNQ